jgi:hypothetical protein
VYLEEEKSMIHSFTVTFRAKYLTGMVTSVPPYETCSLIKNNILHQSKPSWSWSYGSWIYNLLYMQSVPITTKAVCANPAHERGVLNTTLCDKVCQ